MLLQAPHGIRALRIGKIFSRDEPSVRQQLVNLFSWHIVGDAVFNWRFSFSQPAESSQNVSHSEWRKKYLNFTLKTIVRKYLPGRFVERIFQVLWVQSFLGVIFENRSMSIRRWKVVWASCCLPNKCYECTNSCEFNEPIIRIIFFSIIN